MSGESAQLAKLSVIELADRKISCAGELAVAVSGAFALTLAVAHDWSPGPATTDPDAQK